MLDLLFPPYDEGYGRECTYYDEMRTSAKEEEDDSDHDCGNDGGITVDSGRQWPLVALVPIDRPDNFNCLGRSYGCLGSDQTNDCT